MNGSQLFQSIPHMSHDSRFACVHINLTDELRHLHISCESTSIQICRAPRTAKKQTVPMSMLLLWNSTAVQAWALYAKNFCRSPFPLIAIRGHSSIKSSNAMVFTAAVAATEVKLDPAKYQVQVPNRLFSLLSRITRDKGRWGELLSRTISTLIRSVFSDFLDTTAHRTHEEKAHSQRWNWLDPSLLALFTLLLVKNKNFRQRNNGWVDY